MTLSQEDIVGRAIIKIKAKEAKIHELIATGNYYTTNINVRNLENEREAMMKQLSDMLQAWKVFNE